ncbi:MAG TPA: HEAT repeat domain-containing protein [Planctomycetota bacterium]|nr:HEAT repeat domain-containing protein [Planctomycetota bacterium]
MRTALFLLLLPLLAAADHPQIEWCPDFDKAFEIARERKCPVMICINSKDREKANEKTAKDIYHDPEFVELSKGFVMVVMSTIGHKEKGPCPRFGIVTCEEHLHCWQTLSAKYGDRFVSDAARGEMITPQHAWFAPDGTLLARKEFWMDKRELMQRMQNALDSVAAKATEKEKGPGEEGAAPGAPPLSAAERADLAKAGGSDAEARKMALGNLLATEKPAVRAAVIELLQTATDTDVKCDVIRALGKAQVAEARVPIEEHLEHRDATVRSFAAVALEDLGQKESIEPLLKRVKKESDPVARKNACRAVGKCGGLVADEEAAAALLKVLGNDKQNMVKKHAALALLAYRGEKAAPLVRTKLEQAALKTKDRDIRGGIVYTLSFIGDVKTTEPVFLKILEDQHDDNGKDYLRTALRKLRGEAADFGRSTWFLFREDYDDPARRPDMPKWDGGR